MKNFKMNPELKDNIKKILNRRGIQYTIVDQEHISTNISGSQFHKIVIRARMEWLEQQDFAEYLQTHLDPPVAYLAQKEINDILVKQEIGSVYIIK